MINKIKLKTKKIIKKKLLSYNWHHNYIPHQEFVLFFQFLNKIRLDPFNVMTTLKSKRKTLYNCVMVRYKGAKFTPIHLIRM